MIKGFLIFIIFYQIQLVELKNELLIAINCGGEEIFDQKNDIYYEADNYFIGGQSSDFGTQFEIKNVDQIFTDMKVGPFDIIFYHKCNFTFNSFYDFFIFTSLCAFL